MYDKKFHFGVYLLVFSFNLLSAQNDSLISTYYPSSGRIREEGHVMLGHKEGKWLNYFKNGKIETETFYHYGQPDSIYDYYTNGMLKCIRYFKSGRLYSIGITKDRKGRSIYSGNLENGEGSVIFLSSKGRPSYFGYIKDGLSFGEAVNYDNRGRPSRITYDSNGFIDRILYLNRKGIVIAEIVLVEKLVAIEHYYRKNSTIRISHHYTTTYDLYCSDRYDRHGKYLRTDFVHDPGGIPLEILDPRVLLKRK